MHLRFKESSESTSKTKDDRLQGTRKMLRWCLNILEKIIVRRLHKPLKIHTSRIGCLRESIRHEVNGTLQEAEKWLPDVLLEGTLAEVYRRPKKTT
ncbi:hypothetical protein TNCV_3488351 [Trichonephila clavipes]|nr:hypothetical protein TNCV_3488351 [Trichonephila clavipes]